MNATVDDALATIDRLDDEIIRLWQERVDLTSQLIRMRAGSGGPCYRHAEQNRLVTRYRAMLHTDGVQLAQLLIRHTLARQPADETTSTVRPRPASRS
jgi:chorismate mutase